MDVRRITDRKQWDDIASGFACAGLHQSWAWGEFRASEGWRPARVAAFDDGRCVAAVAAYARRLPGVGTLAEAARGPLLDPADARAWAVLPALLDLVARDTGAVFVRLSPPFTDDETAGWPTDRRLVPVPGTWTDWNVARQSTVLDVDDSPERLLARMAKERRRRILRQRADVSIECSTDVDALRLFYEILVEHAAQHRYAIRSWMAYQRLHTLFAPDDLTVLIGRVGDDAVSAQLNLRFAGAVAALAAPNRERSRGLGVNELLQWRLIQWAQARQCQRIDFGTNASAGIAQYKLELGCRPVLHASYRDWVRAPRRYRVARYLETTAIPRLRPWLHAAVRRQAQPRSLLKLPSPA